MKSKLNVYKIEYEFLITRKGQLIVDDKKDIYVPAPSSSQARGVGKKKLKQVFPHLETEVYGAHKVSVEGYNINLEKIITPSD